MQTDIGPKCIFILQGYFLHWGWDKFLFVCFFLTQHAVAQEAHDSSVFLSRPTPLLPTISFPSPASQLQPKPSVSQACCSLSPCRSVWLLDLSQPELLLIWQPQSSGCSVLKVIRVGPVPYLAGRGASNHQCLSARLINKQWHSSNRLGFHRAATLMTDSLSPTLSIYLSLPHRKDVLTCKTTFLPLLLAKTLTY